MKTATAWLALMLGVMASPAFAGIDEGLAAYQRKDWATALREFTPLAQTGETVAQSRLGHMYLNGFGVAKDTTEGVDLITKAAEKGDALAQNTLGGLYFRGVGVPRDTARALLWFGRAADQNQPNALNNLGQLYFIGNGVPKDEAKALDYLRRAADMGVSASWESLGIAYWHGRGVPADHAQAVAWLKKAAQAGYSVAQNLYGAALWQGDDIGRDRTEAVRWFLRSGNQGDAASLLNVAHAKFNGLDGPRDVEEAYYYYLLAERMAKPADKTRYTQAREKAEAELSADRKGIAKAKAEKWRPRTEVRQVSGGHETEPAPAEADTPQISEAGKSAPAKAETAPARPQVSAGSGIFVNHDGVVLTNSHVVKSCRNIRISHGDGSQPQAASVIARDTANDLAALKTSLRPSDIARFRENKPMRPGDEVVAIGFPLSSLLSREPNVTAGVISALNGLRGDKRHYQVTAPIQRGNSGGPLVDMSGHVVGIVSATLNAMKLADKTGAIPQNVNFAIKAELGLKFLTDNNISYETAPAGQPLSAADVGDIMRKATAFVECEG